MLMVSFVYSDFIWLLGFEIVTGLRQQIHVSQPWSQVHQPLWIYGSRHVLNVFLPTVIV